MKRTAYGVLICIVLLFGTAPSVQGQDTGPPLAIEVQKYGDVPYLSAGIGLGERERIRQVEKEFNLKLIFAATTGNYLADVNVVILNRRGDTILKAVSDGPWFFTKLPPGWYTVTATSAGKTIRKNVNVHRAGLTTLSFAWKVDRNGAGTTR